MSNQNDNFDDDFESVKGPANVWNPTKDEEGDPRTEATPEDFITGFYIDKKEGVGEHNSIAYTIETKSGERLSIWGTKMLNDEMDKVRYGQFIKIQWKGKLLTKAGALKPEKKRTTTDSYHAWEVFISKNTPAKTGTSDTRPTTQPASNAAAPATTPAVAPGKVAEEDELPF